MLERALTHRSPRTRGSLGAALIAALSMPAVLGCSRSLLPESEGRTQTAAAALSSNSGSDELPGTVTKARGVAVVELFTSEGCSSCPPADAVLSRLAARAEEATLAVYPLSFHVDYWNYLGWRDRFSSSTYSERQRGYRELAANGGTYTPQAVVNGAAECVGSDAAQLDALIGSALQRPARTQIALDGRRGNSAIELRYRVSGDTTGRVLNLALVQPHAESAVKSGENSGAQLAHVNVVRAFEQRALTSDTAGRWSVALPSDWDAHRVGFIAYAEDATQRDVSGAAALELE